MKDSENELELMLLQLKNLKPTSNCWSGYLSHMERFEALRDQILEKFGTVLTLEQVDQMIYLARENNTAAVKFRISFLRMQAQADRQLLNLKKM